MAFNQRSTRFHDYEARCFGVRVNRMPDAKLFVEDMERAIHGLSSTRNIKSIAIQRIIDNTHYGIVIGQGVEWKPYLRSSLLIDHWLYV